MAPIEPEVANSNTIPLLRFAGYFVTAIALTGFLGTNVYGAYSSLPPSQQTRLRSSSRRKHVWIFVALTVVSLAVKWYHLLSYCALSYRSWADEMDVPFSVTLFGEGGLFDKNGHGLMLGRWLQDMSPKDDFFEITLEKSRRYWWTQQLALTGTVFAVFLGIEGRRRNVRHLWAYMLLSQTVSTSFSINLFFLTILFAPIPLSQRSDASNSSLLNSITRSRATVSAIVDKTSAYLPIPLSTIPILATLITIALLPFATSTPSFTPLLLIRNLTLLLSIYTTRSPTKSHPQTLFYLLSIASVALHIQRLLVAFLSPEPYPNRHTAYLAKLHLYHSNTRPSPSTTTHRLLSALQDHPAAAFVGWDVVLGAISLTTWAVIRGLDEQKILSIVTSGVYPSLSSATSSSSLDKSKSLSSESMSATRRSTRRRKSTAKARKATDLDSDLDEGVDGDYTAESPVATGEEDEDENLEAGALATGLFPLLGLGGLAAGVLGAEGS